MADDSPSGTGREAQTPPAPAVFLCVGEAWQIHYAGLTVYVRDSKVMRYLAYLLAHPHTAVSARALAAAAGCSTGPARSDDEALQRARSSVSKRLHAAVRRISEHHLTLGRHLGACVHAGVQCSYSPDPRESQEWQV